MVIVEYCRYGNLQSYVINARKRFVNQVDSQGNLIFLSQQEDVNTTELPLPDDGYFVVGNNPSVGGYQNRSFEGELTPGRKPDNQYIELTHLQSESEIGIAADLDQVDEKETMGDAQQQQQPDWSIKYEIDQQDTEINRSIKPVSTRDLICWSFQIARGMDYLASKKVNDT